MPYYSNYNFQHWLNDKKKQVEMGQGTDFLKLLLIQNFL